MKKFLLGTTLIVSSFLFGENSANASLLQIIGGSPVNTIINDYAGNNWAGRSNILPFQTMSLVTTQNNVQLTFEYIFRENVPEFEYDIVSFNWVGPNPFVFNLTDIPNHPTPVTTFPTVTTTMPTAGILPFFFVNSAGTFTANGSTRAETFSGQYSSFFVTFNDPFSSSKSNFVSNMSTGNVAWILLDDVSPTIFGHDGDYDDMIIKVTASIPQPPSVPVNEPNSLYLFLFGGLTLFGLSSMITISNIERSKRKA